MSPSARCDEILRLIDEVLDGPAPPDGCVATTTVAPHVTRGGDQRCAEHQREER